MLILSEVFKSYPDTSWKGLLNYKSKGVSVLEDINLIIEKGDSVALFGCNGSGKTTLLKLIAGLLVPDSGQIIFESNNSPKISLVSGNERSFFWRLSVLQNLSFFSTISRIEDSEKKILHQLEILDLTKHIETPYMSLSSGEKKKMLIARAMLIEPELILFDEVTSSLDEGSREELIELVKNSNIKNNTALIWATHRHEETKGLANKFISIKQKRINEEGKISPASSYD